MVICLEPGADLHMAQLMPLPLTVSCFSQIEIGFTFLVLAHLGSPRKWPLNGCVCRILYSRYAAIISIPVIEKNCQARKLNTEDAKDRSRWRKLIKDVR